MSQDEVPRPDCPLATSFITAECSNPDCGLHIIGEIDDKPILEIVMTVEATQELVRLCQIMLYEKAVNRHD